MAGLAAQWDRRLGAIKQLAETAHAENKKRTQQCSITRTDGGPPDWPPVPEWPGGRPISQWPRLQAGRSHDLTARP